MNRFVCVLLLTATVSCSKKQTELPATKENPYAGIWTRSNHTEPVRVENYTIVFHKSDGSVIVQKNTGNRFNEATIQIMKELQPGERITFTNIQLSGPSSWPQLEAKPVEFTIL